MEQPPFIFSISVGHLALESLASFYVNKYVVFGWAGWMDVNGKKPLAVKDQRVQNRGHEQIRSRTETGVYILKLEWGNSRL